MTDDTSTNILIITLVNSSITLLLLGFKLVKMFLKHKCKSKCMMSDNSLTESISLDKK